MIVGNIHCRVKKIHCKPCGDYGFYSPHPKTRGRQSDGTAKSHFCSHRRQRSEVSKIKELCRLLICEFFIPRLFAGASATRPATRLAWFAWSEYPFHIKNNCLAYNAIFYTPETSFLPCNACYIEIFTTSRNAFSQHGLMLLPVKTACLGYSPACCPESSSAVLYPMARYPAR